MNKEKLNPKQIEIQIRRVAVERLHIQGLSVTEIAVHLKVDIRTISRDIHENRKERLKVLGNSAEARVWLQERLADYIAFMDEAKRTFYAQSLTFKTEASKSRALWYAVEIESKKIETIKSLLWSLYDLQTGGRNLMYGEQ